MMKFNRWDQRAGQQGHYHAMLKVMRKYLGSYIDHTDADSIVDEARTRLTKLDEYWADIKGGNLLDKNSSHNTIVELQSLRLQALVNLGAEVWRALDLSSLHVSKKHGICRKSRKPNNCRSRESY